MKVLKMPSRPEPKTWGFEEKDEEMVKEAVADYQKAAAKLAAKFQKIDQRYKDRFWKKIHTVIPAVRGMRVQLKFNRAGKPFVEEEV